MKRRRIFTDYTKELLDKKLLNKGEIKYKTPSVNVITVSHSSSPMESQKKQEKRDESYEGEKTEEMKVQAWEIEEVKKSLPTQLALHKLEAQADQSARFCEGKLKLLYKY